VWYHPGMRARVLAAFALLGCGASSAFDGEVYRDSTIAFRVPHVPTEWRGIRVSDAKLAFRDESREASVLVTARCNVASDDVPLASLTQQLVMGTTEREYLKEEVVPFDGREAMHAVLRAKLDGVRMQYDVYVMKKDNCVYDLVYVAPPSTFDAGAPSFESFASGFRSLDPSADDGRLARSRGGPT